MLDIKNRHIKACGTPPNIDPDKVRWLSYFENADREQSIFIVTQDHKALVYIGDCGWNSPIEVEVADNGMALLATDRPVRLIVNKQTGQPLTSCQEAPWIFACWDMTAWHRRLQKAA